MWWFSLSPFTTLQYSIPLPAYKLCKYREDSCILILPPPIDSELLLSSCILSLLSLSQKIEYCGRRRVLIPVVYCCCCCCLHIKSRSDLYSVPSNIRTGPTDANAFRGHRLTTQKGYTLWKKQKGIKGPKKVNTHAIIGKEKKKKTEK